MVQYVEEGLKRKAGGEKTQTRERNLLQTICQLRMAGHEWLLIAGKASPASAIRNADDFAREQCTPSTALFFAACLKPILTRYCERIAQMSTPTTQSTLDDWDLFTEAGIKGPAHVQIEKHRPPTRCWSRWTDFGEGSATLSRTFSLLIGPLDNIYDEIYQPYIHTGKSGESSETLIRHGLNGMDVSNCVSYNASISHDIHMWPVPAPDGSPDFEPCLATITQHCPGALIGIIAGKTYLPGTEAARIVEAKAPAYQLFKSSLGINLWAYGCLLAGL